MPCEHILASSASSTVPPSSRLWLSKLVAKALFRTAVLFGFLCIVLPTISTWPNAAYVVRQLQSLSSMYIIAGSLGFAVAVYATVLACLYRSDRRAAVSLVLVALASLAFSGLASAYATRANEDQEPTMMAPYYTAAEPRRLTLLISFNAGTSMALILFIQSVYESRMYESHVWMPFVLLMALPNLMWYFARAGTLGQYSWVMCAMSLVPFLGMSLLMRWTLAIASNPPPSMSRTTTFSATDLDTIARFVLSSSVGLVAFAIASTVYLAGASGPAISEALLCGVIVFR